MATDLTEIYTIRHVRPGDPVSAPVSSQPTKAIELRLRALENALYTRELNKQQSQLVIPDVPINNVLGQEVTLYSVVYFNNSTGLYEKAVAGVTFEQDQFQANASALALGICVAVNGNKGDIMVAGYLAWTSAIRSSMLVQNELFRAGVPYYLTDDATQAGRVTQYAPALRVQVLSATQSHAILQPEYGVPEVLETVSRVAVGGRPVGSIRVDDISGQMVRIVAFDGLEEVTSGVWTSTRDSTVTALKNWGWLVADITLEQIPSRPVWIRVEVSPTGTRVISSNSLETLTEGAGGQSFNERDFNILSPSNYLVTSQYPVFDSDGSALQMGTLSFSFVDPNIAYKRICIFQFPASFQGWKMVNPPVIPQGIAVMAAGLVAGVTMVDGGAGYLTPPRVTFDTSLTGNTAKGTALLNPAGSVQSVRIDTPGGGYGVTTVPLVTFDSAVQDVTVTNGGQGATLSASVGTGSNVGKIVGITVTAQGSGYLSTPSVVIVDKMGVGRGAQALAIVNDTKIVEVVVTDAGSGYTAGQVHVEVALPSNFDYAVSHLPTVVVTMQADPNHDKVAAVAISGDAGFRMINGAKIKFWPVVGNTPTTEAVAIVVANPVTGLVESINLTNPGAGYAGIPTAFLAPLEPQLKVAQGGPSTVATGTVVMSKASVNMVEVRSRGIRYSGTTGGPNGSNWTPLIFEAAALTGSDPAVGMAVLDGQGSVIDVILQHGGSGYNYPPTVTLPVGVGYGFVARANLTGSVLDATISDAGTNYQARPTTVAVCPVKKVTIADGGSSYAIGTMLTVTGGSPQIPAILEPTFNGASGLSGAQIIYPGKGYVTAPTIIPRGPGSGAVWGTLTMVDGQITGTVATTSPGTGYLESATCTVEAPDPTNLAYGEKAVVKPRVGGLLSAVKILTRGSGQVRTPGVEPEIVVTSTSHGYGIRLKPLFNAAGELTYVEILEAGCGYLNGDPSISWSYTGVTGGTNATLQLTFTGFDQVSRVDLLNPGWGYTTPPKLLVSSPNQGAGTTATLAASLLGTGAQMETTMWGLGPPLLPGPVVNRNRLQIRSWYEDMGYQVGRVKPEAAYYYNLLADLQLRQRYPPVPLDRASFVLNGTELVITTLSETLVPSVLSADVWLANNAIYWPTPDALGAPWDSSFQSMIYVPGMPGVDCKIPDTALTDENLWRWRSQVYGLQPQINVAWMHLGRASQFYTAGRVSGLAVLPPLQLVNLVTGEVLPDNGLPATGILGLQLSSHGSIFSSGVTVDLTQPNILVVIYQNGQRQPVFLSSFLIRVTFQSTTAGEVATVNSCARITIGTSRGNYQNMVGNFDPSSPNNSSVATTLYEAGQMKELLPDLNFPSVLVYPGEAVYLRVTTPAGSPIRQQSVDVSVRGYVL